MVENRDLIGNCHPVGNASKGKLFRKDIYVLIVFLHLKKAVCLDRQYNDITDLVGDEWKGIYVIDCVQVDCNNAFYPQCPGWAHTLVAEGHNYSAFWTNYFD